MMDFANMIEASGLTIAEFIGYAATVGIGILLGLYGIKLIRAAFEMLGGERQTYNSKGYTSEHYEQQWAAEAQMDRDQYVGQEDYGYEPSDDDCPACGGWVEKGICTKCQTEVF